MDNSARFCRKCGHPSGVFEAQTQKFDAPPQGAQTSPTNFAPTGAAYVPPGPMAVPAAITQGIKPSSKKPLLAIVAGILLICLISFVGALVGLRRALAPPAGPPFAGAQSEPPVVPPPGAPAPPAPPQVGAGEADSSLQAYIYPGSVKTMDFTHDGKGVIQLTSNDPVEKVTAWYRARLKPTKTAQIPFGAATVMEGKDIKAIITGSGSGTVVVLTKGDD